MDRARAGGAESRERQAEIAEQGDRLRKCPADEPPSALGSSFCQRRVGRRHAGRGEGWADEGRARDGRALRERARDRVSSWNGCSSDEGPAVEGWLRLSGTTRNPFADREIRRKCQLDR